MLPQSQARKKAQLVEGEPAHLVHLSHPHRAGDVLFCGAAGVAGQTDEKNRRRDGEGEAAGETQGTGEAEGGTAESGNAQGGGKTQGGGGSQSAPPPPTRAPPTVAPPAAELPSFEFEGGKAVETSSDPVQLYKGYAGIRVAVEMEPAGQPRRMTITWRRWTSTVDRAGEISDPVWRKGSGDPKWDDSVRQVFAAVKEMDRPPPTNFPSAGDGAV